MIDDDVPNPLAGVDLDAWYPPAPSAEQIEAIVQRHAGTRTDVAAAIEVTALPPTRSQRVRWVAAGILIGAAAAALIAFALWPASGDQAPNEPPVVAPGPGPMPQLPGGTIRDREREATNRVHLQTLELSARNHDWQGAVDAFAQIGVDSAHYAEAASIHAKLRDEFIAAEVATAKRLAAANDCAAIKKRADDAATIWKEAGNAVRAVACTDPIEFDFDPTSCDADALVAEARQAGAANQWSKMLERAEAANQCKANKASRQLALMAACKLKNRDAALKYRDEFRKNAGMRQTCMGVVDMEEPAGHGDLGGNPYPQPDPPSEPSPSGGDLGGNPFASSSCDADLLVAEARQAGQANQWSKVLQKAEASNRCRSNKAARQLALLAACKIGDKSKAMKYWREFENNAGMRMTCVNTIGE
jgi:hypothetical protein